MYFLRNLSKIFYPFDTSPLFFVAIFEIENCKTISNLLVVKHLYMYKY